MTLQTTAANGVKTAFRILASFAVTGDYVHLGTQSYNTATGAVSHTDVTDSSVQFLPEEYAPIEKLASGQSALGGSRVMKIQHGDWRLYAIPGSDAGKISSRPESGDYATIGGVRWDVVEALDHGGVLYEIQFRKPA